MKSLTTLLLSVLLSPAAMQATSPLHMPAIELFPRFERGIIYNYGYTPADTAATAADGTPEANGLFFEGMSPTPDIPADKWATGIEMPWFVADPDQFVYDGDNTYPIPYVYLGPAVYNGIEVLEPLPLYTDNQVVPSLDPLLTQWITRGNDQQQLLKRLQQHYMLSNPAGVKYDTRRMATPPREFTATIDPATARILIKEVVAKKEMPVTDLQAKFDKTHWLKKFDANLQFSQAYVSPNWYQGGNNNLNALLNLYYNVKLNPAFHKKLLFENTFQYKLGMNNAPDDEMRDYNISEDLLQWNMTFGFRSAKSWYYSIQTQFKTQVLNNYKPNSHTLKAAFMSPGELNVGVGMTYNHTNKKKTFTFDASLSPLSYNLKTCTRRRMNEAAYGIKEGRKTVSEYGSSAEGKVTWKICENISLRSRLFAFTDYDYLQSDWENTLMFTINRYLTTQIYVHCRYDSTTPPVEDSKWHKLQVKEILSFGFTYKFSTI